MEDNSLVALTEEYLMSKIYVIRGVQVMLDVDLAAIYGYTTKNFNRQVKNNIDRFDDDFRFQLTDIEVNILRCKNCTSSWGGARYLPYAFTELGIYALMMVLKGNLAIDQSKKLIHQSENVCFIEIGFGRGKSHRFQRQRESWSSSDRVS